VSDHAPDWDSHGLKAATDWLLPFHHRKRKPVDPPRRLAQLSEAKVPEAGAEPLPHKGGA
jgi:hypothetical protein